MLLRQLHLLLLDLLVNLQAILPLLCLTHRKEVIRLLLKLLS